MTVAIAYFFVMSTITFMAYFLDKAAAAAGRGGHDCRVSEASLHALALLGGWPGALLARLTLHHKTRKQPFVILFWLTAAINVAAVLAIDRALSNW